ncbi:hypothetical protein GCM10010912_47770 [Paenibacillus albidus]|uniref:Uncharacterized protein n=1 Tax=Paenibacillus albidus TaxID=2041023 RepID=A0A917CTU9_9BACL|nr:hypothetical protein [Paenibacillus albidus]GGF97469.1 hypothetical protein GCM10010912_47770 [Paenibacillus albidus]
MNNFLVLRLLDRLEGGFRRIGVDYRVMRSILQMKLTMDGRRTPTVLSGSQRKDEKKEGSPFRVQWMYVLMGVLMIMFILPQDHFMLQMSLIFSITMFMITTTLISDFSSVMLDLRDKNILFSKPVNRITLNMAKSIHILVYLLTLTLSLTGPTLIVSLFRHGILFFLLYAGEIILMDCFILVITALLYLLIMKFFDGEKLKDIINYVQILLTIGITVGYQLVSRLFNLVELSGAFKPAWWQYFISPVWFAAPFEMLFAGGSGQSYVLLTVLALLVPLLLIAAYVKLMPLFEQSVLKLAEQGTGGKENGRLADFLSRRICRSREEGMFFRFSWSMMKKERDFKLKVYPSLGFSIVFPFIFILNPVFTGNAAMLKDSRGYLFIYFSAMMLQTILLMLRYSASYKGAWIYRVIPLPGTGPIYRGMLKAALFRLLLPLFLVEAVLFIWLFGIHIIPQLAAALLSLLIYAVLCFRILPRALPFSEKFEAVKQKDFTASSFILLFILAGLAGVHYIFTLFPAGVYVYLLILVLANALMWKRTFV